MPMLENQHREAASWPACPNVAVAAAAVTAAAVTAAATAAFLAAAVLLGAPTGDAGYGKRHTEPLQVMPAFLQPDFHLRMCLLQSLLPQHLREPLLRA